MDDKLLGIDHLIVGVRDLEAARAKWGRLGFNTTPRGRHAGWGTANYCIMMQEDYVELLGIVDASQFTNGLDRFLERREGLLGLALGSADADATHRAWAEAGLAPAAPRALGRLLELDGGTVELRFRNVMLDVERTGGLSLFASQHLTPELLRRPAWVAHPNGARKLRSCLVVADDPAALRPAIERVFGSAAVTRTDNVLAVHTGHGAIVVAPPEDAALMHPHLGVDAPAPVPELRAMTVEVADRDRAARFLTLQGVAHARLAGGDIAIPPAAACGVGIELTA